VGERTSPIRWPRQTLVVLAAASLATAPLGAQRTFTVGSRAADVRRIQGAPSVIERLRSLGVEIWTYAGGAAVRFSPDSLVIGWDNVGGVLRAHAVSTGRGTGATTFEIGSARDDVLRLQGAPGAVRSDRASGVETWRYGRSSVRLSMNDGRVIGWLNADGNLRVGAGASASTSAVTRVVADVATAAPATPPVAPAILEATITFREPSGDGVLEAGESGSLTVMLRNRGRGAAQDVRVQAIVDSGARGVRVMPVPPVARLERGSSTVVAVPITAQDDASTGEVRIQLTALEANGFDLAPTRRVVIRTRALVPPRLALAGVRTDDQSGDGRIQPRELVEVTARVWNAGAGPAHDVQASIVLGEGVFLTPESPRRVSLGTMAPGEHRDLLFTVFTNGRSEQIPLFLALTERTHAFGATLPLELTLERPLVQTLDVPAGTPGVGGVSAPPSVAPSLTDDVERDVPVAPVGNPDAIAIVFGVERYRGLPPARFAARDAQLFRRYVTAALGVRDDRDHLYARQDADVTGNEFRKLFGDDGWLARRARPSTDVYVFFSGHGGPDPKTRVPYLLPGDADANYARETGYSLNVLYEQLARLHVRSINVFLDACFTGMTRSNESLLAGARPIILSVEHPALLRDNFAVFAASRGDQIASDYPTKRAGLFTYELLRGLKGAADLDGDRSITVGELERFLTREVPPVATALDREQTPFVTARNRDRVLSRLPAIAP
jgi:hypothetical protein